MPGDVHHVVDAAEQPEVAVLVPAGAVARQVDVGPEAAEVVLDVAVGVPVDGPELRRPRPPEHQVPALAGPYRPPLLVEDVGIDAGERPRGRPGLQAGDAGQRCDQDAPGLGLPPGVDHRAALAADVLEVPHPGLRVDRLADRAQQAQGRQVMAGRVLVAPLHEGADGGGGGVEDRRLVALDDRPPPLLVGEVGRPLVHDRRRPVGEWAVDDVGVPRHPADVGGAPEDVGLRMDVEDEPVGRRHPRQVAAGRVQDALRLPRRPGRVEDVERILRVHLLGGAGGLLAIEGLVVPDVALGVRGHLLAGAPDDDDVADRGALRHRRVRVLLQGDDGAKEGHPHEQPARELLRHGDAGVEAVAQHDVAEHQHHHQCERQRDQCVEQPAEAVDDAGHAPS